jgi:FkbM family methyltransferase
VVGLDVLNDYAPDTPILITPWRGTQEITIMLEGLGFRALYYYNHEGYRSAEAIALQAATSPELYDRAKTAEVEALLADEKSAAVFRAKLSSWFKCEHVALERLMEDEQYFPQDIIRLNENEVFVDCGVMDGGTICDFANRAKKWRYVYGFEPMPVSLELSRAVLAFCGYENVQIEPFAVAAHSGKATFVQSNNSNGAHRLSGCNVVYPPDFCDGGTLSTVEARSLDEFGFVHCPTFIKMDIEGGELDALRGAANIIRENHPKLAVSVYHNPTHLWEIPLLMKDLVPEYKIYFRQHALYLETVCYAVCDGGGENIL